MPNSTSMATASVSHGDLTFFVQDVLRTSIGDANLDGVFNSSDFVVVLVAGEYEDGVDRQFDLGRRRLELRRRIRFERPGRRLAGRGIRQRASFPWPPKRRSSSQYSLSRGTNTSLGFGSHARQPTFSSTGHRQTVTFRTTGDLNKMRLA